jgi:hypothetical protein
MRFRLRTLMIVLLLAPPVIAIYVAAGLAARDAARAVDQIRLERALLEAERASLENERTLLRVSLPPGSAPAYGDKPSAPSTDN